MSDVKYATIIAAKFDRVAPANPYATGYGPKIPTRYWVRLATDPPTGPWRRVYMAQFGNAGSPWVVINGKQFWLSDSELEMHAEFYAEAQMG